MVTLSIDTQIEERARKIVFLLMKRPITEEIAMEVGEIDGFKHLEIENGDWTGFDEEKTVGGERHGWIESLIVAALTIWAIENKAGRVYTGDTDFVMEGEPKNIILDRKPDIGFVSTERIKPSAGFNYLVPDLAIEITSPTDTPNRIQKKITEYLEHDVKQVWQIYPETKQIIVYLPDGTSKTYKVGDTISGGDLLPNFELEVAKVFEV